MLMQTGLEAFGAYGTPTLLTVIVLHYAGKSVVAFVGRKRGNGKAPVAPAKCWLDDSNHERMIWDGIGKVQQACEVVLEKGSGGDKTPLVWRDTSIAKLVEKQTTELTNLHTTLLRMHDKTDMKELAEAMDKVCSKLDKIAED